METFHVPAHTRVYIDPPLEWDVGIHLTSPAPNGGMMVYPMMEWDEETRTFHGGSKEPTCLEKQLSGLRETAALVEGDTEFDLVWVTVNGTNKHTMFAFPNFDPSKLEWRTFPFNEGGSKPSSA